MDLEAKIEALLFFRGEPTPIKKLAEILEESEESVSDALESLKEKLDSRGLTVLLKDGEAMLGTNPALGSLIEKIIRDELHKDLGRAGLETLSIILYLGPVSRSQIDYIRGVSSTFILRNLLIRGLVERVDNPSDRRSFLYKPTFELLSYLGITKLEELPEYADVRRELEERERAAKAREEADNPEDGNE